MPDNDSSETKPKPNEPAKPQNPETSQNPQDQTSSNNQQNTAAPGVTEGAAAGTEAAQNRENGQAAPLQAPSSGEASGVRTSTSCTPCTEIESAKASTDSEVIFPSP